MKCHFCGKDATKLVGVIDYAGMVAASVFIKEYVAVCKNCEHKVVRK